MKRRDKATRSTPVAETLPPAADESIAISVYEQNLLGLGVAAQQSAITAALANIARRAS